MPRTGEERYSTNRTFELPCTNAGVLLGREHVQQDLLSSSHTFAVYQQNIHNYATKFACICSDTVILMCARKLNTYSSHVCMPELRKQVRQTTSNNMDSNTLNVVLF